MTKEEWDYWKRQGPNGEIYEIYRTPRSVTENSIRFASMQRLKKNLTWSAEALEMTGLHSEWLQGWFSFDTDGVSKEQVDRLVAEWADTQNWPGRL